MNKTPRRVPRARRSMRLLFTLVLVSAAVGACVRTNPPTDTGNPVAPSSPSNAQPTPVPQPTPTPTSSQALAYTPDLKPIFDSDCVICHSGSRPSAGYAMATYSQVMRAVAPGNANSPLVIWTQPGGSMYRFWTGNPSQKATMVRQWVVNNNAAQTRLVMKHRVLVTVAAAFLFLPAVTRASEVLKPGQPAPAIQLARADGTPVPLANPGKVVLIDFWASWCAPCKASFPALDALYQDLRDRGFEVIAVNVDERNQDAQTFLVGKPHSMTVVFDPKGTAPAAFGVSAMPTSFLIGRDGRIRFVHVGYTAKTIDAYRREIEELLGQTVK